MKRIGIIYYSRSDTCRRVATRLAGHLNCEAYEVSEAHPRIGALGDLACAFKSFFRLESAIRFSGPRPAVFDHVVYVTPVWMRALSSPIRTFLKRCRDHGKSYSLVCVMSEQGAERAAREAAVIMRHPPLFTLSLKQYDVLAENFEDELRNLANRIKAR